MNELQLRHFRWSRISLVFQSAMNALNPVMRIGHQITESIHQHFDVSRRDARESALALLRSVGIPGAERRLRELRQGGPVELVVLRPAIVHGPRSAWTGGFADELLAGTAYLVEGGRGICNAAYVDNVVHAVRLASSAPAA